MNVRLKRNLSWYSAVVYNDQFLINNYTTELTMLTVAENNDEQNIAYERIKVWVYNLMTDAIFISQDHPKLDAYRKTGARVITFPGDPVDQIVGIMLYLKLNSIMENRMVVTDVELWSEAGDNMKYLHSISESLGPLTQDGWWIDPRPVYADAPRRGKNKVISLDRMAEWKDYDLAWDDANAVETKVVFADFNKNENK
jgi:hypothetical protein